MGAENTAEETKKDHSRRFAALALAVLLVCFVGGPIGLYLLNRLTVAEGTHALTYVDPRSDSFANDVRSGCSRPSLRNIWIYKGDPRFIADKPGWREGPHRYVVLDGLALKDSQCIAAIRHAALVQPYPIRIVFVERGREIAAFNLTKEEK